MTSATTDVSPVVRMFLSELTEVRFGEGLYVRRAHIKRAYMEYLKVLGVSIKLSPFEFYSQVALYFNGLAVGQHVSAIVSLETYKGVDVLKGIMVPEFYGCSDNGLKHSDCLSDILNDLPRPEHNPNLIVE